jgi:caa(3)-type oxidase subunit IV
MGWWVFVGLAVLTVVEYVIAVTVDLNLPVMAVIAVVKAGLIVWYFMHLLRLWRAGEGGY